MRDDATVQSVSRSGMTLTASRRRWWVLTALVLVVVTFDLNLTMINVALPALATDLGASSAQLQWFSSSYSLMVAAALLPAGLLGDRYGLKRPLILALLILGLTALACTQASTPGQLIAGQLVLGAVLVTLFVVWLQRAVHPIVDPALFGSPQFRGGVILSTLLTFALMGAVFTVPQYFHVVYGAQAMESGLRLMPIIIGLLGGVTCTGLIRRVAEQRMVIALGFALLALGAGIGAMAPGEGGYLVTAAWLTIAGIGIGFAMPSSIDLAMGAVPESQNGVGSGTLQAVRQVGGTFGIAILGSLLAGVYSTRVDTSGLDSTHAQAVGRTASAGLEVAAGEADAALADSVRSAFIAGMDSTLWASAGVAVLGAALALLPAASPTSSSRAERGA